MPKNKGKGGKNRKRGKNEADDEKQELVFKEDGQEYAQVLRMLGNGRCEAMCIDGTKRLCHIRGKMHKKVWIAAGDIILVSLHDYQDDKADVILKYMPDEARLLKAYGELPENTRLNEGIAGGLDEKVPGAIYVETLLNQVNASKDSFAVPSLASGSNMPIFLAAKTLQVFRMHRWSASLGSISYSCLPGTAMRLLQNSLSTKALLFAK
eukprot:XP_019075349.1 PREDICTED: eukaryotic translation initiation factor 1A-like [Vitis vinifera]